MSYGSRSLSRTQNNYPSTYMFRMVAERSASESFDRCQTTTRFTDSSACEETNPVSAVGAPHVTSVTGEKFDLWKTGWSSFVQIPKDIQPESVPGLLVAENVVPYDRDKCDPVILQNVQISGSVTDGHEVLARADQAENDGVRESSSESLSGTLQQNKILRVTKKNLVKKCLEMLAEIAELKDDYLESYEQFGKCLNSGNHEDSTVRAEIAELLRLNASASEDEQLNLKEYVDRTKADLNNNCSIASESIAAVSSSSVLGILRKKSPEVLHMIDSVEESAVQQPMPQIMEEIIEVIQLVPVIMKVQKAVEVSQVQYIDKIVDVLVVAQRQVPTVQTMQKTVEGSLVQLLDRVVDVPVMMQRQVQCPSMPQERIQWRTVEETIDVPVPQMKEEFADAVQHSLQERVQSSTVEQSFDVSDPRILEEIVEVIQLIPQDRMSDCIVEQTVNIPSPEKIQQVIQVIPQGQTSECVVEQTVNIPSQQRLGQTVEVVKVIPQERADIPDVAQRRAPADQGAQKTVKCAQVQFLDKIADVPVVVQRQVPMVVQREVPAVRAGHKFVEDAQAQFIEKEMDVPAVKQRRVSTTLQTARKTHQTVEVARVIRRNW